ncbi:hypothetical protein MOBT1_001514 [Malassezia obtusa]|uniref:SMP-LTD domain-containing protein n=1 Tax=Malassezia obtusa TaxID=76774 RepID=A0AAF0DZH3_9BASI|nr:hypothetical protein MOBT1_001514 [Malassezia obtusa]
MLRDLFLYLLGGVTFLPLCLLFFYIYEQPDEEYSKEFAEPLASESELTPVLQSDARTVLTQHQARDAEQQNGNSGSHGGAKHLSSWIIIKNSSKTLPRKSDACFHKDGSRRTPSRRSAAAVDVDDEEAPEGEPPRAQRSYMSYVYRGFRSGGSEAASGTSDESSSAPRTDLGRSEDEHGVHYAILKPPMLYIYNGDDVTKPGTECVATINLENKRVSIWSRDAGDVEGDVKTGEGRPLCPEGSLFTKRNALHIAAPTARRGEHWYIMTPRASQLEDWYFALHDASRKVRSPFDQVGELFSLRNMELLVQRLDDRPEQIMLRWLNAMLGRIFLAISHTEMMESMVLARLNERLERIQFPRLITDVTLKSIDLGSAAPTFGSPILKQLSPEGEASMEASMHYRGNLRIMVGATLSIPLGQRFKPYKVSVVLAVIVRAMEGNLLLQIKPPPSNRIWYGFTAMPKIDLVVEPVISARKVRWSLITSMMENKVRESIAENLVVPHMNSVPFFNTQNEARRGGIWNDAAAKKPVPKQGESLAAPSATDAESMAESAPPDLDKPAAANDSSEASGNNAQPPKESTSSMAIEGSSNDLATCSEEPGATRPLPETPSHNEHGAPTLTRSKDDLSLPPPPRPPPRFTTHDEYGEIPIVPQRKSRINTLARTLQDTMDRDGRQVMARDARDALKRGWSNWSSKRAEAKKTLLRSQSRAAVEIAPEYVPKLGARNLPPPLSEPELASGMSVLEMPSPAPSDTLPVPGFTGQDAVRPAEQGRDAEEHNEAADMVELNKNDVQSEQAMDPLFKSLPDSDADHAAETLDPGPDATSIADPGKLASEAAAAWIRAPCMEPFVRKCDVGVLSERRDDVRRLGVELFQRLEDRTLFDYS